MQREEEQGNKENGHSYDKIFAALEAGSLKQEPALDPLGERLPTQSRSSIGPFLVINKNQKLTLMGNGGLLIHHHNATMIIDGELENEDSTNIDISVNNLIVTPRGKATFNNGQITAQQNIIILGNLRATKCHIKCTLFLLTGIEMKSQWNLLRKQISWLRETDNDCRKKASEVISYAENKLRT